MNKPKEDIIADILLIEVQGLGSDRDKSFFFTFKWGYEINLAILDIYPDWIGIHKILWIHITI